MSCAQSFLGVHLLARQVYTAVSRKVVGKSARDNPERYCGWFFGLLVFKEISKNGTRGHGLMFASAKGKQQKLVRQLECQEQCIDHIPYYLSRLSRAQFLGQPF